jgi:hypothetical protein
MREHAVHHAKYEYREGAEHREMPEDVVPSRRARSTEAVVRTGARPAASVRHTRARAPRAHARCAVRHARAGAARTHAGCTVAAWAGAGAAGAHVGRAIAARAGAAHARDVVRGHRARAAAPVELRHRDRLGRVRLRDRARDGPAVRIVELVPVRVVVVRPARRRVQVRERRHRVRVRIGVHVRGRGRVERGRVPALGHRARVVTTGTASKGALGIGRRAAVDVVELGPLDRLVWRKD